MRIPEGVTAVGVKIFQEEPKGLDGLEAFEGASYCEAASRAKVKPQRVRGGSIGVCKWSPAILAFKEAEDNFEKKLQPRLQPPVNTVLLAPLDGFPAGHEPDTVILQGPADTLWKMVKGLGKENWAVNWAGDIDKSALGLELAGQPAWKIKIITRVNRGLTRITPSAAWQRFTRIVFRSKALSAFFGALINPFMASMSVCRNSTAIPYLGGKANLSFFCAGGILWGSNPSTHMTCGVPYSLVK
jgi:hypothetical protein